MKKEWRKPQLNELNVKQTKADASGRPIPVSYPGVITCHEPVSGPVSYTHLFQVLQEFP